MAIKTQLKLAQLSGSMIDLKSESVHYGTPATVAALTGSDLQDILGTMAAAIHRIHGQSSSEPFNAAAGFFYQPISVDVIAEKTSAGGVTVDGVLLKDGGVQIVEDGYIGTPSDTDLIQLDGTGNSVKLAGNATLKVDTIAESDAAAGVTIDGVLIKDNDIVIPDGSTIGSTSASTAVTIASTGIVTLSDDLLLADDKTIGNATNADLLKLEAHALEVKATKALHVDIIEETTGAAGVTIDGVLFKDNDIVIPNDATIGSVGGSTAMTIASTGIVTFADDIKIKDDGTIGSASDPDAITIAANGVVSFEESIAVDVISEETAAAGVTIDGVLHKDGGIKIANGGNIGSVGDADAIAIAAGGDVTLSQGLTVMGDMIVQGVTTTVSSSNMVIKDPIIALGVASSSLAGGSITLGEAGDRGFAFPMNNAPMGSPVFFWDHGGISNGIPVGCFRFGVANTSGSDSSISLNQNANSDAYQVFGGLYPIACSVVKADSIQLLETSGDYQHTVEIGMEDATSLSANRHLDIGIDGQDRYLRLSSSFEVGVNHITNAHGAGLTFYGHRKIGQDLTSTSSVSFDSVSGSNGFHVNYGNPVYFHDQDNSKFVRLKAPATVAADVTLTLPGDDGTSGQALITDGNGVTSWSTISAGGSAADDISVGDAAVSIRTTTGGITVDADAGNVLVDSNAGTTTIDGHTGVTIQTAATSADAIDLDSAGGINLDTGNPMSEIVIKAAGTQYGLIVPVPASSEKAMMLVSDYLHFSASHGEFQFIGDDAHYRDFFKIKSGSSGAVILSASNHSGRITFMGNSATELFSVGGDNVQIVSGKSLSFNGSTNTTKITAQGNNMDINAAADIVINAGGGNFKPGTDDSCALGEANYNWSDLFLADAAVISFGDDQDASLTHVHNTGIQLSAADKLLFGDTGTYIVQSSDGLLDVVSDTTLSLTGPTSKIVAATSIQLDSPVVDFQDDGVILQFGDGDDVTLTHVHNNGLLLNSSMALQFGDSATNIMQISDSNLSLQADGSVILNSPVVDFEDDGVILKFGDGSDVSLTHVHDTGLQVNAAMKLMFASTAAYISHDGTDLQLVDDADINIKPAVDFSVDAGGDILLDAGGSNIKFLEGGTVFASLNEDGADAYLNFGTTAGTSGYGIVDDGGVMKWKSSGGSWAAFSAGGSATGSHPTKVQYTVTGTHATAVPLYINSGQGYTDWVGAGGHGDSGVNFVDVYVNGQLLVSGSAGSLSSADYVLLEGGVDNQLKFSFALELDDVVTVKRIRQS